MREVELIQRCQYAVWRYFEDGSIIELITTAISRPIEIAITSLNDSHRCCSLTILSAKASNDRQHSLWRDLEHSSLVVQTSRESNPVIVAVRRMDQMPGRVAIVAI